MKHKLLLAIIGLCLLCPPLLPVLLLILLVAWILHLSDAKKRREMSARQAWLAEPPRSL